MAIKEYAAKLIEQDATLKEIAEQKETLWVNPKFLPFEMTDAVCQLVVSDADIADAEARLERFAPFIRKCFPETECTNGIIESPLKPIPEMQKGLIEATGSPISGNLFLKMDSHLAVAGSVCGTQLQLHTPDVVLKYLLLAVLIGVFAFSAGFVYQRNKSRRGALLGAVIGTLLMAVLSVPLNYFVVYPAYVVCYHLPLETIIGMYQAIRPSVDGLLECLLVFNMPFTFFKGLLDVALCFLIYKPLSPLLHK